MGLRQMGFFEQETLDFLCNLITCRGADTHHLAATFIVHRQSTLQPHHVLLNHLGPPFVHRPIEVEHVGHANFSHRQERADSLIAAFTHSFKSFPSSLTIAVMRGVTRQLCVLSVAKPVYPTAASRTFDV